MISILSATLAWLLDFVEGFLKVIHRSTIHELLSFDANAQPALYELMSGRTHPARKTNRPTTIGIDRLEMIDRREHYASL